LYLSQLQELAQEKKEDVEVEEDPEKQLNDLQNPYLDP